MPDITEFDYSDDELRDEEYPDESDDGYDDDDDENDTVICSNCGADVYEDSECCPKCGEFLTTNTSPLSGRSMLFVVLGIAGIVATIWALLF